jgi:hypothetical protein
VPAGLPVALHRIRDKPCKIRMGFRATGAEKSVECTPKVRQGYKGQVLERRTDVQEKAPYFQPGVQAFGD